MKMNDNDYFYNVWCYQFGFDLILLYFIHILKFIFVFRFIVAENLNNLLFSYYYNVIIIILTKISFCCFWFNVSSYIHTLETKNLI